MTGSFLEALVYPGLLYNIALAFIIEWLDRKLVARFQNRVGPYYTGPQGLLQPLADFLKLLSKEAIVPKASDKLLLTLNPIAAFIIISVALAFMPLADKRGVLSLEGDVVIVPALLTLYLLFVYTAGASSLSRYSFIGAARAAMMLLGFEIPLMLSCVSVALAAGSFRISDIVNQGKLYVFGPHFIGFLIYLIAAEAELDRQPFDIPEAETEIVSGWLVEYSSWRLAIFRLSKDLELLLLSSLAVTLFLGGPCGPTAPGLEGLLYPLYFNAKLLIVIFLLSMIRAAFGRVRIDQFIHVGWRMLIPASFLYLAVVALVV